MDIEGVSIIAIYAAICVAAGSACLFGTPGTSEDALDLYILLHGVANITVVLYRNETARFHRNYLVEIFISQYLAFVLVHQISNVNRLFDLDNVFSLQYQVLDWNNRFYNFLFMALWLTNMVGSFCLFTGMILFFCELYLPEFGAWLKSYKLRTEIVHSVSNGCDPLDAYAWLTKNLLELEESLSHESMIGLIYRIHLRAFAKQCSMNGGVCKGCNEKVSQTKPILQINNDTVWHIHCFRLVLQRDKQISSPRWIEHIRVDSNYEDKLGYFNLANDRARRLHAKQMESSFN